MVDTVDLNRFRDGINRIRPDSFSYEAFEVLFDWYEELEQSMEEQLEFYPLNVCIEWTEFDSAKEAADNIGTDVDEDDFDIEDYDGDEEERQEDLEKAYKEELENNYSVLEVEDGRVLVQTN